VGSYDKEHVGLNHIAFGVCSLKDLEPVQAQLTTSRLLIVESFWISTVLRSSSGSMIQTVSASSSTCVANKLTQVD
jgi:hypothetical protein